MGLFVTLCTGPGRLAGPAMRRLTEYRRAVCHAPPRLRSAPSAFLCARGSAPHPSRPPAPRARARLLLQVNAFFVLQEQTCAERLERFCTVLPELIAFLSACPPPSACAPAPALNAAQAAGGSGTEASRPGLPQIVAHVTAAATLAAQAQARADQCGVQKGEEVPQPPQPPPNAVSCLLDFVSLCDEIDSLRKFAFTNYLAVTKASGAPSSLPAAAASTVAVAARRPAHTPEGGPFLLCAALRRLPPLSSHLMPKWPRRAVPVRRCFTAQFCSVQRQSAPRQPRTPPLRMPARPLSASQICKKHDKNCRLQLSDALIGYVVKCPFYSSTRIASIWTHAQCAVSGEPAGLAPSSRQRGSAAG